MQYFQCRIALQINAQVAYMSQKKNQKNKDLTSIPTAPSDCNNGLCCRPRRSFEEMLPDVSDDAIDLLKKLTKFNPDKRLTAEQALKHPYVRRFHNPTEERNIGYDVVPPLADDVQLSVEEYRNKLYEVSGFFFHF